jgi:hypothetical protein
VTSRECDRKLNTEHRTAGNCPADSASARILTVELYPERRFQLCGTAGLALAIMLAMILTRHAGLSYWVMARIVEMAVATFLGLVMATKMITGEERIIYYHHEIVVMLMAALFLWTTRQPLLPYLDATILGIGLFLSFGRIGCLMVGCCHGRPHHWGVRYSEEQAAAGFPSYLVGVQLFPIQAVESVWVLGTVMVGTYFVWSGRPSGTALAWYVVTYDLGRFAFEFARGDAGRPYWLGFSQPQWLSLLLTGGVVWAERAGRLPLSRWHLATFASLITIVVAVSLQRRFQRTPTFRLLHPRHIQQVANAVKALCASGGHTIAEPDKTFTVVSVASTSLGVQISGGQINRGGAERVYHYTLSSAGEAMTEGTARSLAGLIRRLNGMAGSDKLIAGAQGVFHLLICVPEVTNS